MNLSRIKSVEASIADTEDERRQLKRSLTVWDLAVMGIAVAVGAGIFSVGAKAAGSLAGPAVTISFIIAGITCALAIMCYAEFASTIPVAGSAYTFTYATLGEFLAWIVGWDLILEMFTAAAVVAKFWGVYFAEVLAIWDIPLSPTIELFGMTVSWPAFVIVAFFTVLLALGTKLSSRVSAVFTIIKVAIIVFVVVAGLTSIKAANYKPFIPPSQPATESAASAWDQPLLLWLTGAEPSTYGFVGIISAAALVFFAFLGFDVVATSAEETKDPQRTLPRGIFAGLFIVTILYVLVALTLTGMVHYSDLASFGDEASLATAFAMTGKTWAASVISVGALAGLTTVIMVLLMGITRIIFALSRDGLLPRGISETSTRKTPARIQIVAGLAIATVAAFTNIQALEHMVNIGTLSAFILVSVGVLVLRKSRPDLKRGFTVPFGPVIPILSTVLCTLLMLNLTTLTWLRFVVWLVIGIAIYFAWGYRHSRLNDDTKASS